MKITLSIPDDQYEQLEAEAGRQGVPKWIGDRLTLMQGVDPKAPPLTLTQAQVRQLQELLSINLKSADQLIEHIKGSQLIQLGDGVEVDLPPDDLYSLQQQAIGMGAASFEDYMRDFIQEAIAFQLHGSMARR